MTAKTDKIIVEIDRSHLQLIVAAAMAGLISEEGPNTFNFPEGKSLGYLLLAMAETEEVLSLTTGDITETLTFLAKEVLK